MLNIKQVVSSYQTLKIYVRGCLTTSLKELIKGQSSILSPSILKTVTVGSFLLSFLSTMLTIIFFCGSLLVLKIVQKISLSAIEEAESVLQDCDWGDVRKKRRKIIEYIKFGRMIDLGYEFRSNTNIMLHEQQEGKVHFLQQKDENRTQFEGKILEISCKLNQMSQQIACLMTLHERQENILKNTFATPLNFHNCFQLYSSFDIRIKELQNLHTFFCFFKQNPFTSAYQILKVSYFILHNFEPKLKSIVAELNQMVMKIEEEIQLNSECCWIDCLLGGEEDLKKLQIEVQRLSKLPQYQQIIEKVEEESKLSDYVYSDIQFQSLKSSPEIRSSQIPKQMQMNDHKRHFMNRLDALLILGMARKRQQLQQQAQKEEANSTCRNQTNEECHLSPR